MHTSISLTALFALLIAPACWAGDPASPNEAKPAESAITSAEGDPAPVSSGIRVFVDPATGRRTSNPTADQRRAAAAQDALNRSLGGHENFTYETLPSGATLLRTHGGNQSVVIAKPGASGKAELDCTDPLHQHLSGIQPTYGVLAAPSRDER